MIKTRKDKKKVLLTRQEEFAIFHLIIDKFMWLGVAGIAVGLFYVFNPTLNPEVGLLFTLTGATISFILTSIAMKNIYMK